MPERPPEPEADAIERHPDYLPEPDFFDEDDGPEDEAPEPAAEDRDES